MTFEQIKNKVSSFTVGIAGCGGLGSNCASMLIRSGVQKIIIADFDVVAESNLNRQFFFKNQIGFPKADCLKQNLLQINTDATIDAYQLRLDENGIRTLFSRCDVIVEAFDAAESKLMIIEAVAKYFPETPLVCASGLAGIHNAERMLVKRSGQLVVVGDFGESVSENNPPLAPKVTIAAALQANEVLRILLGL